MSAVTGQDNVIRMMVAVREGVRARMLDVMQVVGFDMEAYVKEQKLSGQVLNRRTGRLRNSINSKVEDRTTAVASRTGTGVWYGKVHEYGFQGTVDVPAHERMQTMAFGRPMTPRKVLVRAHPMRVNLPEKSFLRSSLRERGPVEVKRIRGAMIELIEESRR